MSTLPQIMIAPNGARRGKQDHPALPVTIAETVDTVLACHQAGAGGAHLHVRNRDGTHSLDAGLYRELLGELVQVAPDLIAQITTEAVGMYTSQQQQALLRDLRPDFASVALREITDGETETGVQTFFHWAADAGIGIQHILYTPDEVAMLADLVRRDIVPAKNLETMLVLGRYSKGQRSGPQDLDPYLTQMTHAGLTANWAVCAFGHQETDCLVKAINLGGKARIGFENNLHNSDGTLARDNAQRVSELVAAVRVNEVAVSA